MSQIERRGDVVDRVVTTIADTQRSVVLRGPAGIGKTQVADAATDRLLAAGRVVRRVVGGAAQQRLDFGALIHLLPTDEPPVTVEFELMLRLRAALVAQGPAPTVVVIDDVDLLDPKSAGLVESLVRQDDVVVLATERTSMTGAPPDHVLSGVLFTHATVVDVPPLTDAAVAELLVEWAGPGEEGAVRRLAATAEGNPLVARELLAAARARGAFVERDGLWHLTDAPVSGHTLERLVGEHLARLGDIDWDLLRCVSVAGSLPRRIAERIDRDALERLERDGLLGDDPTVVGHPLYVEVIRASLSAEQERRLCAKLVATVGPGDDVDAARLGRWLLRAEEPIPDDVARAGAHLALARWENDLARDLVLSLDEPTVADRVALVWAHANAGRLDAARDAADAAVAAATTDEERVDAGLARAELWCLQLHDREDGYRQLAELQASLSDETLIARVAGATALYSQMTGNRELAERAVGAAVGTTSADLTDEARLAVLLADAYGKVFGGRFEAAGPVIAEGLELADRLDERHNRVRLRVAEALRLLLLGRLAECRAVIDDALRLADVSGVRPAHVAWLGLAAQVAELEGDYSLAERRAHEAVRAGEHVDDFGSAGFVRGDLSALRIELGHGSELDDGSSPIGLARADVRLAGDDDVDALAARHAAATAESGYVLWAPWIAWEAVRRRPAPQSTALLRGWADAFDSPVVVALADHADAMAQGDVRGIDDAVARLVPFGVITPAIDASLTAAEILLGIGPWPPMTTEPAGHDGEVGLRRRMLELGRLIDRVDPVPPGVARRHERLLDAVSMPSDRQLEIARLAAQGLASKEIATRLVVSVRTVDNHLAAVYKALGVHRRDDLADLPL